MNNPNVDPSSTGIDPKVAGLLCYVFSFVSGIIFLVIEKRSSFVKFHAAQSLIVFGALTLINIILGFIPIIGTIISFILVPLSFVLWIVLMLLALQGKQTKLPIIGDYAEQLSRSF
ncbi:hypothetical protein RE628_22490 [Paenibacillus sp. D2_2]|uniref:DUF4870 domain-containing protein n=1 Tax=Paenibacillus sp. D2_2 TaxID=3073092 RepID=UPI0028160381|nr:DUF4870 domain-containing protein [Paenibacillus sp. D2_2]WMT40056.1 hypothetical protein RE628_22490 [Paenibacillus sp. D2_2]